MWVSKCHRCGQKGRQVVVSPRVLQAELQEEKERNYLSGSGLDINSRAPMATPGFVLFLSNHCSTLVNHALKRPNSLLNSTDLRGPRFPPSSNFQNHVFYLVDGKAPWHGCRGQKTTQESPFSYHQKGSRNQIQATRLMKQLYSSSGHFFSFTRDSVSTPQPKGVPKLCPVLLSPKTIHQLLKTFILSLALGVVASSLSLGQLKVHISCMPKVVRPSPLCTALTDHLPSNFQ